MPTVKFYPESRVGGWMNFLRISTSPIPFEASGNAVVFDVQTGEG